MENSCNSTINGLNESSIAGFKDNTVKPIHRHFDNNTMEPSIIRNPHTSEHSSWDLIVSKINEQIAENGESNDDTKRSLSMMKMERLLCEIEQILYRLQLLLSDCCCISFDSKTSTINRSFVYNDKTMNFL